MAYVKVAGSMSSRYPFYGVGQAESGPEVDLKVGHPPPSNSRTADQVLAESQARKVAFVKVHAIQFEKTMGVIRDGRAFLEEATKADSAVRARWGAFCEAVTREAAALSEALRGRKDYGSGVVMVPRDVWISMQALMRAIQAEAPKVQAEVQPARLVVPNGMTVEEAQARGEVVESTLRGVW